MENTLDFNNREQKLAYELIANTNSSFFLTGRAGTGKTTFLRKMQMMVDKQFITLAPTGIAAILAGGDTIHSFFGLPMDVCSPGTCGHMNEERILALIHADAIIIDEVSMMRCDIVDAVDNTMRKIMCSSLPFGGKQVIFVGDLFQLPPVVRPGAERELLHDLYDTDDFFFYHAKVFKNMRLVKIEFQKVYRQEDEKFLQILENVRLGSATFENLMNLNKHVGQPTWVDGSAITLTSMNKTADAINQERLAKIDSEEFAYKGIITDRYEEKRFPVEMELKLKVGAQVMFARNDQQKRWANGTIGTVTSLTKDTIRVKTEEERVYEVPKCTWESYSYEYDREEKKLKKTLMGTYTQYPLRLAWAITMHKSQGMTFDKVYIDLRTRTFAPGQLYVALSRVRSLQGLFLSGPIRSYHIQTNQNVLSYSRGYNNVKDIVNEIESGKAVCRLLAHHNYDEAAKQYLLLAQKKAEEGDVKEAMIQAKHFLDTVICDEELFGCIHGIPAELKSNDWSGAKFLVDLLSLYAGEFKQALAYINSLLPKYQCSETLYIKSRCLMKLKRYREADAVIALMGDVLKTSDAKALYMISMLNKRYLGQSGLKFMQELIKLKPKYDRGIVSLRYLMKQKRLKLIMGSDETCELVADFNSRISDKKFALKLGTARVKASKEVEHLLRIIRMQAFT